jgi:hypothetical protein
MRGVSTGVLLAAASALGCSAALGETPRFNYMLHCQGCHLADGGETPNKIPPLIAAGRFLFVEGGREFLVRVPGVSLSVIDDDELAELVNWMLYEFSPNDLPEDFEPYSTEEVARYRQNPLVEVVKVRANLLTSLEQRSTQ